MQKLKVWSNSHQGKLLCALIISVLCLSTIFSVVQAQEKMVTISDNEKSVHLFTEINTVGELFDDLGVVLVPEDTVNFALTDRIDTQTDIVIDRARRVYLTADKNIIVKYTQGNIVADVLVENNIALTELDRVYPSLESEIADNMSIRVTRVQALEEKTQEKIPFEKIKKNSSSLLKGKKEIATVGVDGTLEKTFTATYEDGIEVSRELVKEEIIKDPIDEITRVGTKVEKSYVAESNDAKSTSSGKALNYSKKMSVKATAYDPSAGSKTATGAKPKVGIVAVDPKVIPLGTRLYIESSDGGKSWVYGYCVAGDTGGAIKNNRVDLFYNTRAEALKFGVKSATVYILD